MTDQKKEEIQEKLYHAKTVEEILAIAVEAEKVLTIEEATKLLQKIEAERAMEKQGGAPKGSLSDEEMGKVTGGYLPIEWIIDMN